MGRLWRGIAILVLALLTLGCPASTPKEHLVLWTAFEGSELETLKSLVSEFETSSGRTVVMLKVPFASLRQKVLVAGPALQGPDVLIGPHDWVGMLQTADLIAPVPEGVMNGDNDDFYPICHKAVNFAGQEYLAPMMMECVVLARNTDLCPEAPESLDQLVDFALQCQSSNPGTTGFSYELKNFYFSWAFLAGFGTDFLEPFSKKNLDIDKLNFATPEAAAGLEWIASLEQKHKLVKPGVKNDITVDMFLNKKLGMMLCGPWNLGDIRKAGVNYALEPIPAGPKAASSPFVGITGAMLSRYSADKPGVKELMLFLSSPSTSARLCEASGRPPTRKKTAEVLAERLTDQAVIRDMSLFADAAEAGTPLPNHPAMQPVWDMMEQTLELVTTGQVQPLDELKRTTERVRSKIRFMLE